MCVVGQSMYGCVYLGVVEMWGFVNQLDLVCPLTNHEHSTLGIHG